MSLACLFVCDAQNTPGTYRCGKGGGGGLQNTAHEVIMFGGRRFQIMSGFGRRFWGLRPRPWGPAVAMAKIYATHIFSTQRSDFPTQCTTLPFSTGDMSSSIHAQTEIVPIHALHKSWPLNQEIRPLPQNRGRMKEKQAAMAPCVRTATR